MHSSTSVLVALPLPRHGGSAAAELTASHTDLNGAILSIEGARTHARGISTRAVAVFRAFSASSPANAPARRRSRHECRASDQSSAPCHMTGVYIRYNLGAAAESAAALGLVGATRSKKHFGELFGVFFATYSSC